MTRVLVTGGNGFIGQHLVSALVARNRQVRVLDLLAPAHTLPDVQYVEGSVLDSDLVDEALRDVGEVYHLAALPGMWLPNKTDFQAVNYHGTEIVITAARKSGVSRFLHCSTESILFPAPSSLPVGPQGLLPLDDMPGLYTRSKMLAEQYAMHAVSTGFPLVIGTPTMPIGPHDHNLTPPTAMLLHFMDGRLHLYLDFIVNLVDVRDVAAGLILTMENGQIGHRYILGSEGVRLKRILELTAAISGRRNLAVPVPGRFAELAASAIEFIADHITRRTPTGTAEGVRIALRATDLTIEKARQELGYAPRPVEPALRDTITYLLGARGKQ